jgi:Cd2+/Zn2+-exporting ATPase
MNATTRLDLPRFVPAETVGCNLCLTRFEERLQATTGVQEIHVDRNSGVVTLHYDADLISEASLEAAAEAEATRLGTTYTHRVLPIEGMDCADCAMTLERGVGHLDGVRWVSVNFAGARMSLEYAAAETNMDAISKRVSSLGYRVSDGEATAADESSFVQRLRQDREMLSLLVSAVLTVAGLVASWLGTPALASTALFVVAIATGGVPIARKGYAGIRAAHQLDINALMTIAVVGAALIGQWSEAATVVVLFALGEALEGFTVDRARRSIRSLMNLAPAMATVRTNDGERELPVAQIAPGDVVVVRPGGRIPADGMILAGQSTINQAPITGESMPVDKTRGDSVFAGTVNGAGVLDVRVSLPASDSTLARIIHMVEDAQAQRAPTQRFVDVFARYYTPAVVVMAAAVAVLPPLLLGDSWIGWLYRALVLLVIACPCALVISTPVSIVAALSAAARSGVLIKGGAFLEIAGSLRALAFDKTGTLTRGEPSLTTVIPLNDEDEIDVLTTAAAAERYSEHPIGAAIVKAAKARGIDLDRVPGNESIAHSGLGIETQVDVSTVRVGTRGFVAGEVLDPAIERQMTVLEGSGQTAVLVARDAAIIGLLGLSDKLRPEATAAIKAVKRAGIAETIMLTGDRREVAQAIANEVGVDSFEPELLPGDKVSAIERLLKRHGRVGMVGDGINDAPALARSTVGIAMGVAGSPAALETADIALMGDDLAKVAYAMRLSRSTKRVILQNISLALVIKVVFLTLAIAGTATLWEAVFADVGASLIVIANGMRLLRFRDR